jgi:hypothetical protein
MKSRVYNRLVCQTAHEKRKYLDMMNTIVFAKNKSRITTAYGSSDRFAL